MLIMQFDDKLRRWNCIGAGTVRAKEGKDALHSIMVNSTEKLTFTVLCGSTRTAENQPLVRSVFCAVYNNGWNSSAFDVVRTLKKGDTVLFAGWVKESTVMLETGEQKMYKEVRIEWIAPLKTVLAMTASGNMKSPIIEGSFGNDGLDFD